MLSTPIYRAKIPDEANQDSRKDANTHKGPKFVHQAGDWENPSHVENSDSGNGEIESPNSIAVVIEANVVTVRDWVSLGPDTRECDV